ncbi:DUF6110 family protein [Dolosigranulum savutiense]|uniref:DUF6110 family protein n=1 Tax=Dolosigranulum savutiense TaxID=3110288 RepID=A0AB74TJ37_9LACT
MLKKVLKATSKSGGFVGGLLAGTVGLKVLTSKTTKKMASHAVAQSLKVKESIDDSLSTAKQHLDDVYEDGKAIYAEEKTKNILADLEEEAE